MRGVRGRLTRGLLLGAGRVRVDDVGVVGLRIAEVPHRHAGGREDRLVGVEADLAGVAAGGVAGQGRGAVLADEHAVDRGQGRQVGAEQDGALRNGREARRRQAEDEPVAGALQRDVAVGVVDRQHGAAAAFVEGPTGGQRDLEGFAVTVFRDAVLAVDGDAFEVALQAEVHDAGGGVRAVGGRGAAGDDFDVLDQGFRDGVEVDRTIGVRRLQAAAVHEDQGALGAEAAQRGVRLTAVQAGRGRARVALAERAGELGHLRQRLLDGHLTGVLDGGLADGHDRAVGDVVGPGDTRTGDDHLLNRGGVVLRLSHPAGEQGAIGHAPDHQPLQRTRIHPSALVI